MYDGSIKKRLKEIEENNNPQQYAAIISLKKTNRDLKEYLLQETNFLSKKAKMTERMYCVLHDIDKLHYCKNNDCDNPVTFHGYTEGYPNYCSCSCVGRSKERLKKMQDTCLKRYGSTSYLGTQQCLTKTKKTLRKKYGVNNINQVPEVIAKKKEAYKRIYGVESHTQREDWKEEQRQRILEKYGTTCVLNSNEIQAKIRAKNKEKYGCEIYMQSNDFREKKKKTLKEKYGIDNILQVPKIRQKAIASIKKIYGTDNFKQSHYNNFDLWNDIEFIKLNFIRGKLVNYKDAQKFYNASYQALFNHFKHELKLDIGNRGISCAEYELIDYLKTLKSNIQIEHDNRDLIKFTNKKGKSSHRQIDIYLPKQKIAIEYSGLYYHGIGNVGYELSISEIKRRRLNTAFKYAMLNARNIKYFDIWENEWENPVKRQIWESMLAASIGIYHRIYARQCVIKEIDPKQEIDFLNQHHMQGYVGGSRYRYGLYFEGFLLAIMTFGKARFNNDAEYELLRFATHKGYQVIGGASKLFKHFTKQFKNVSIISYANKRWSSGNLYRKLGCTKIKETEPGCFYFNLKEGTSPKMFNFMRCQKHNLKKWLPDFDVNISARQNLINNEYSRIYDAGQIVFLYVKI